MIVTFLEREFPYDKYLTLGFAFTQKLLISVNGVQPEHEYLRLSLPLYFLLNNYQLFIFSDPSVLDK